MDTVLVAGLIVGMSFGLFHGVYVYGLVLAEPPADTRRSHTRAIYSGLFTFALWALLGTYVLVLWLVGVALYIIFKAFR